jgi:uncharacterized protein YqeY
MTEISLRQQLRAALPAAMKSRDRAATAALRATLAAIDNAEAVAPAAEAPGTSLAIEHIAVGVGAPEVARRALTEVEVEDIVRAEVVERETAADEYEQSGYADRAEQLRNEARALAAHHADAGKGPQ